jgi:hypothetical protein
VLHVVVEPEIERGIRIGGGDDIPARAPAADVIERSKTPGDVIGPICSVAPASADNSVNGSNEVTVWLRLSALTGMFSTAR